MNNLQKFFANATFGTRPALLIGALLISGCASIVGSDKETLRVSSTPPDAQILIIDEAGRTVYRGRTPDQIALPKSNGRYWGGKTFSVAISKRGYLTQRVQVDTHPNALYLGGNYLFGGLIGWLLVDATSSRMYELSADGIQVTLPRLPEDAAAALVAPPAVTIEAPAPEIAAPLPPPVMRWTPPPAAAEPAPTAPADAPPATPTTPRPYWPEPPPLPVSPSTAAPGWRHWG
jgi:hypothetical protein